MFRGDEFDSASVATFTMRTEWGPCKPENQPESGTCVPATPDMSETVVLEFEDGRSATRNGFGCGGERYRALQGWLARFRELFE